MIPASISRFTLMVEAENPNNFSNIVVVFRIYLSWCSDAPLEGNGGIPVEATFLCLVPDEVVAQFPFGTDGELVVGTVTVHNIEPELWLRQEDESALVTASEP